MSPQKNKVTNESSQWCLQTAGLVHQQFKTQRYSIKNIWGISSPVASVCSNDILSPCPPPPDFLLYYWAANNHSILYWPHIHSRLSDWVPIWAQIKETSCKPSSLTALICSPLTLIPKRPNYNPIGNQALRIWRQFRFHFGLQSFPSSSPCNRNPAFPPSLNLY